MYEDYEGKFVQFYLKTNQAGINDISGIVERVDANTMPNGTVDIVFVLDTQQETTYDIPYRNVSFMAVSREAIEGTMGRASAESKSLGMPPSQFVQDIVSKKVDQVGSQTESADEPAELSLGGGRKPVARVAKDSMQVD